MHSHFSGHLPPGQGRVGEKPHVGVARGYDFAQAPHLSVSANEQAVGVLRRGGMRVTVMLIKIEASASPATELHECLHVASNRKYFIVLLVVLAVACSSSSTLSLGQSPAPRSLVVGLSPSSTIFVTPYGVSLLTPMCLTCNS